MLRSLVRAAAALAAVFAASAAMAEKVPESRLKEFAALMPAAPDGYTRGEPMGFYSSDSASSVTATYKSNDGKSFSIVLTFSKDNAKQNAELLKNAAQRKRWGFDAVKIKDRDALARSAENKNKFSAIFLVVLGDRIVSATDSSGTADHGVVKAVFEKVDFDAIGNK